MKTENIKVWDKLYIYDPNKRNYDSNRKLIYSDSFWEVIIESETKKSWALTNWRKVYKLTLVISDKKYWNQKCYTRQGMMDDIFMHENKTKVMDTIRMFWPEQADKLREIVNILYKDNIN